MSQILTDILVVIAAVFLVWLVIRLFRKPIRWILKLLLNTAIGFAALFLLNFFGSAIGITLGLNWINALVIGVAWGQEKVKAIKACLVGGYISALATDQATAESLLA